MIRQHPIQHRRLSRGFRTAWDGIVLAVAIQRAVAAGSTNEARPTVAPASDWVVPQSFVVRARPDKAGTDDSQRWLLWERQFNPAQQETFNHSVRQLLTVSGVQDGANLTVDYHPSYQSLTFHWVRIWRGSGILNRLDPERIKVIQSERELDEYLLSGKQSALLILDDVRVGDIVDCAYSLRGANPILEGKFSGSFPVQLAEPADHLVARVLWPGKTRLFARNHGCSVQPVTRSTGGMMEYIWDLKSIAGLKLEDQLPSWCDPEPWVQLSEIRSWAEVNEWARALFQDASAPSPELAQQIAKWKRTTDRQEQVLEALRFIQEEVRYFGIELGANSHRPSGPSEVFGRRYGDCKDKTLLFVSLMRALGIEAYPALVNTEDRRALDQWQPSQVAFDHAMAQVILDGRTYWLDPTMNYQRGPLASRRPPDYERALVIRPGTTALTVIPQPMSRSGTVVTEYFQARGIAEPADLKVVTVAEGTDADDLRRQFATARREDVEKGYLRFYAGLYPGIRRAQSLVLSDNEQLNRIEITEFYTVDKFWVQSQSSGIYRCEFYPSGIAALLRKPVDTRRTLPLAVPHPRHQILRTEVRLPLPWAADARSQTVFDPAFSFRMNLQLQGNRLTMEYEYQSLADSVPPGRVAGYLEQLNRATLSLGGGLFWP